MVIYKCDICNKEVEGLYDTLIIYSKKIDYCRNCKLEAERIRERVTKEFKCEKIMYDSRLRAKERKIINDIKNKNPMAY